MTDATCKQSLQVQLESAQQDAESWRLAYLDLLDRVLSAPSERSPLAIRDDLLQVANEIVNDMTFGNTTYDGRKAYNAGIADAARIAAEPKDSRPLATVRVVLSDRTQIRAVVIGKRQSAWLLSSPGIGRFYSHGEDSFYVHPEDLVRLEGAK